MTDYSRMIARGRQFARNLPPHGMERAWISDLLDALEACQAPPVPEGWKLVPVKPTEEMLRAGAWANAGPRGSVHGYIYAAMLAASPDIGGGR